MDSATKKIDTMTYIKIDEATISADVPVPQRLIMWYRKIGLCDQF